jgi:hypothetical protein
MKSNELKKEAKDRIFKYINPMTYKKKYIYIY